MRSLRLLLAFSLLCGCTETAMIRTVPPDANLFIDGQPAGKSPLPFTVERSNIRPYDLRIEKKGYDPIGDVITPRIAPGRMVGAIFTLGILYIFRSPYYLSVPRDYLLSPSVTALQDAQRDEQDRMIGEALRNLDQLHKLGAISDEEFKQRRDRLLNPSPQ